MSEIQHYILFPNHDNAMRLYRELKKAGGSGSDCSYPQKCE